MMDPDDTLRRELNFIVLQFLNSSDCPEAAQAFRRHLDEDSSRSLPRQYQWFNSQPRLTSVSEIEQQNSHVHGGFLFDALKNCTRALNHVAPRNQLLKKHLSFLAPGVSSLLRNFNDPDQNYEPSSLLRVSHYQNNSPAITPVECPALYPPNLITSLAAREISGYRPIHHLLPVSHYSNYKKHRRLLGHLSSAYCLLFDYTGRYIITGADDRLVKIWSASDGRLLMTLRGHSHEISDLSIDPENSMVAAASCDKEIRIWSLRNGAPITILSGHNGQINNLKFCPLLKWPDKRFLVSGGNDGNVCFWSYDPNTKVFNPEPIKNNERKKAGSHIVFITFSKGGEFMALGTSDNHLYVYHVGAPNYPVKIFETDAHLGDVDSIMFSNRSMRFISGAKDNVAMIWRYEEQTWRKILLKMDEKLPGTAPEVALPVDNKRNGPGLRVSMVGWTCDDAHVMTSVNDFTIKVWDSRNGELIHILYGHEQEVFVIDGHPSDPRIFLSGGHDGAINIWDVVTGQNLQTFYNAIEGQGHGAIFECRWAPDGLSFTSVDSHGHITFFGIGPSDPYQKMPEQAFFHTDYRPLAYDRSRYALDDQNQIAPHLMGPPFLVDIDGNPYGPEIQNLVPGRDAAADAPRPELVPPLDPGVWECLRGKLLKMAEDEAAYYEVERKKRPEVEEAVVNREETIVTRRKQRIAIQCRGVLDANAPLEMEDDETDHDFVAESSDSTSEEDEEEEVLSFHDDSDDSDFAPQQRRRVEKPKEERPPETVTASGRRSRRVINSSSDERNAPNVSEPPPRQPKKVKKRPAPRRRIDSDDEQIIPAPRPQASTTNGHHLIQQVLATGELPEKYKPPEWLTDTRPKRSPYFPQIGDEVVYFRSGHQEYLNQIREKAIYPVSGSVRPYKLRGSDSDEIFARVRHVEYLLIPETRLVELTMVVIDLDREEQETDFVFKIKYHDMDNVCDFIILKELYDKSIGREWKTGDDFRSVIDDKWWTGKVLTIGHDSEPRSFFQCFGVVWNSEGEENLSPWDLEPIKRKKRTNPNSVKVESTEGVPLTAEEKIQYNSFECSQIDDEERERLLEGFIRIMQFSQSELFTCPVDLNEYHDYAMTIPYPIDLSTIKSRIENKFYRTKEAIKSDAWHIYTNAEMYNLPTSEIVKKAHIVASVCKRFIDDMNCFDPTSILMEVQAQQNRQQNGNHHSYDEDTSEEVEDSHTETPNGAAHNGGSHNGGPAHADVHTDAHTYRPRSQRRARKPIKSSYNYDDDDVEEENGSRSQRRARRPVKSSYTYDDDDIDEENDSRSHRRARKAVKRSYYDDDDIDDENDSTPVGRRRTKRPKRVVKHEDSDTDY